MTKILLATVNAKFQHASFGLRYLYANLGQLQSATSLREWSLGVKARDVVEDILAERPRIVGLSVYIWNVEILTEIAQLLKRIRPEITLVIGGPEVSHEYEGMEIFEVADYLIRGEADLVFPRLCESLLVGHTKQEKVTAGGLPLLSELAWPYPHYNDFDLKHGRVVYVEASRGCPFQCHFCLSSLDRSVRSFPLDQFLQQMKSLLDRGVNQFKFVDRTFNLKAETSKRILSFFLDHYREGLFCHFEMIPDRLPDSLRPVIAAFPAGALQFEVGIQSFNQEVCKRIGRRQNFKALEDNLRYLSSSTGVHVHADLIAGLPGEDINSFGQGFDKLYHLGVSEIQVGILKRLRGTPITLLGEEWEMVYSPKAPYEVLSTSHLSFFELQRLHRFARFWDLVANSGRFPATTEVLLAGGSPFWNFLNFADWLYKELEVTSGISPKRLGRALTHFLREERNRKDAAELVKSDRSLQRAQSTSHLPKRQARHVAS